MMSKIPIENVDSQDPLVIDDIFDRLNRNGEPLRGQELRNSKYYRGELLNVVAKLAKLPFWASRLEHLDAARMEDLEFVSELLFELLEEGPLAANQAILDEMYEKYSTFEEMDKLSAKFVLVTDFMDGLNLDYSEYRIQGVSHLYGLWCLSERCVGAGIATFPIDEKLSGFFEELRSSEVMDTNVVEYKRSMSSRTKSETQRKLRLESLTSYLGLELI